MTQVTDTRDLVIYRSIFARNDLIDKEEEEDDVKSANMH